MKNNGFLAKFDGNEGIDTSFTSEWNLNWPAALNQADWLQTAAGTCHTDVARVSYCYICFGVE
jgi:hypothetical protein